MHMSRQLEGRSCLRNWQVARWILFATFSHFLSWLQEILPTTLEAPAEGGLFIVCNSLNCIMEIRLALL